MSDVPDEQSTPAAADGGVEPGEVNTVPETWAESDLDRLARQVSGPEDQIGISALWRVTMSLDHWWFIAIGPQGQESPAAADVGGDIMLLAFSSGDRARDFAVSRDMIGPDESLNAIALAPREVVESAESYQEADIDGLIFDAHLTGFSIPPEQLGPVWGTVMSHATADDHQAPSDEGGATEAGTATNDVDRDGEDAPDTGSPDSKPERQG